MTRRYEASAPLGPRSQVVTRRGVLCGLGAGAVLAAGGRMALAACGVTPPQAEGPFYPVAIGEADWDLTQVGGGARAEGEVIEVVGRALDARCRPVPDTVIEVWQANAFGLYDHPRDRPRGRSRDPNFQGFARLRTDREGGYRFVTIVPGAYPVSDDWTRPPHIHFKVYPPAAGALTTQMYFDGHPLNDPDRLQRQLSPEARAALRVAFDSRTADGLRRGVFDLVLPNA